MKKVTFGAKLRYFFDNTMAKGTPALISWLAIISGIMILITATVVTLVQIFPEGSEKLSFPEAVWQSLMRTLDSGTVAGDAGWNYRLVSIVITIFGIFIVSTLISILSAGLESKLEELRKGRSFVVEKNHTLILGWSHKIFTIISELVVANESQRKGVVVILADKDKVEMETEIRDKIPNTKNTRVVCRSGNPYDMTDLAIVNPSEAKSIVILNKDHENSDFQTIKTLLAITNNPNRKSSPYHIICEIRENKSLDIVRMIGKEEVEFVLADEIISRIMVQTCRQSGLSIVYTELMDFDGDEMYFQNEPALVGKTFGESLFAYPNSSVMGLQTADGLVKVNPPMDTVIQKGDKIIAITEDDDTLIISKNASPKINEEAIVKGVISEKHFERSLILGWNKRAKIIIRELNNYVSPGSVVKVVAESEEAEKIINEIKPSLKNLNIEFIKADITERSVLDSLDVVSFDHIILLCYDTFEDIQESDSLTLVTLLHLRNISEQTGKDLSIVSEMLDIRNRELAEVTKADDFVVSDKLISLLISQVSENKKLMEVFNDIFDADGSEIYMKPATSYIKSGISVDFYTVVESARRKNEVAIGYRIATLAEDASKAYGVVVNPDKTKKIAFTELDKIIVVAED